MTGPPNHPSLLQKSLFSGQPDRQKKLKLKSNAHFIASSHAPESIYANNLELRSSVLKTPDESIGDFVKLDKYADFSSGAVL